MKVGNKTSGTRVNQSRNRLLKVGNRTRATRVKRPRILMNKTATGDFQLALFNQAGTSVQLYVATFAFPCLFSH